MTNITAGLQRSWRRVDVQQANLEASVKYRVTWTIDIEANDEDEARSGARDYLLSHEHEALARVVRVAEHVSGTDVPEVDAEAGGR